MGGGIITIFHAGGDGGTPIQPFVVGDANSNGTALPITTGQFSITSQSFPRSSSVGNIVFSTDDGINPPPTPIPPAVVTPTPPESVTPPGSETPTPPGSVTPPGSETPTPPGESNSTWECNSTSGCNSNTPSGCNSTGD